MITFKSEALNLVLVDKLCPRGQRPVVQTNMVSFGNSFDNVSDFKQSVEAS